MKIIKKLLTLLIVLVIGVSILPNKFKQALPKELQYFNFSTLVSTVEDFKDSLQNKFEDVKEYLWTGSESTSSSSSEELYGSYRVSYVIDGDTFLIEKDGERVKVRLIGVDTPESVASDEYLAKTGKENTAEGKQASDYTTRLLSGAYVWLEYDEQQTDAYGRTLAYVYLDENKETMLQEVLLTNGMAKCMKVAPNTRYAQKFEQLEQEARANNIGLWSTGVFDK